jgi:integrase
VVVMRGSVVKKNDRWYVIIEDRDPATGERKRRWHSGFRTKREAQAACNDLASAKQRGDYLPSSKQTVAEFVGEWLEAIRPTVRVSTHEKYTRDLRTHIVANIGFVPLDQVDGPMLNRLWAQLAASGRRSRRPGGEPSGLSAKSVQNVAMVVHRLFKDAVRWGRLNRNPADMADPPRRSARPSEMKAWSADTLQTFLEATVDDDLYPVWVVLATTGLRRGEALGLRWNDVDLELGRASITQTVTAIGWEIYVGPPKTSAGRRRIALDPGTCAVLRRHRAASLKRRLRVGDAFTDHDLVFAAPDGGPLHPERAYQAFKRAIKRHGLPNIALDGLRHTWATVALENGVHPRVVQERLGHSSIATTLQIYSHVLPTMHDEAASLVAQRILPKA